MRPPRTSLTITGKKGMAPQDGSSVIMGPMSSKNISFSSFRRQSRLNKRTYLNNTRRRRVRRSSELSSERHSTPFHATPMYAVRLGTNPGKERGEKGVGKLSKRREKREKVGRRDREKKRDRERERGRRAGQREKEGQREEEGQGEREKEREIE